ncbi:MAG: ThuA domain-containing protein, partial [Verrucomicrobiota bacterium]
MKKLIIALFCPVICVVSQIESSAETTPVRALLITGGCCHDYFYQSKVLTFGVRNRANVEWTVVHEGAGSTDFKARIYDDPEWAEGYDVVVHNECFAKVLDEAWIEKIADRHMKGLPAVVIHCAMHTYRDIKSDAWRKFLGVTSKKHEHKSNKKVINRMPDHPIMQGFPEIWTSPVDELYIIEKVWPTTKVLADGISDKKGTEGEAHAGFWINEVGDMKVFGTTFGHSNETFDDTIFLDTVTRGLLWTVGKLGPEGLPHEGYGPVKHKKRKPRKKK